MTGPEHYAEAEQLLHRVGHCTSDSPEDKTLIASLAQVHATLALASITQPTHTNRGDEFVYEGIGKQELDRLRSLLSHSDRDRLTAWEVVEIAADDLERLQAVSS